MVMSLIKVLLSGLPQAGGFGSPPKIPVTLRINVDLPQPESAARPMTTTLSSAAWTRTEFLSAILVAFGAFTAIDPINGDATFKEPALKLFVVAR